MMATKALAWRLVLATRALAVPQQVARHDRQQLRCMAALGFRSGGEEAAAAPPPRVGRPSKTAAKQEAKAYQDVARQLSRLTEKQLVRLQPLVGEEVVDAVSLAARISHRNQGRQRQESLVAKLLRERVQDTEVAQLQAAIESVRTGQGVIANPAVEQQVQLWLQALLSGEAEAATEVFGLAQSSDTDLQLMRQLIRQAQQTEAVAAPSSSGGSSAEAAAAPSVQRPTAKAQKARKQLRALLQPLAKAQLAAEDDDEE